MREPGCTERLLSSSVTWRPAFLLRSLTYAEMADRVGLRDIQTFELHRSHISAELFKSIIMDMDVMLMQYGPLPEHTTEGYQDSSHR